MSVTLMGQSFSPIRRTIKNNNIFLVTDYYGNVIGNNSSGYGLYCYDTRFISRLELKINDIYPVILSSSTETGHSSIVIGTNPIMQDILNKETEIPQETIQIKRESIIYGSYFETITIANYNLFDTGIKLEIFLDADFLDIFEVRSIFSANKNIQKQYIHDEGTVKFIYTDITNATLSTEISFIEQKPERIFDGCILFEFKLGPNEKKEIKYQIKLKSTAALQPKITAYDFEDAFDKAIDDEKLWKNSTSTFLANNEDFNEMIQRGCKDIAMLKVNAYYGEYIAAGIPWYTTLFGRDSLITARQSFLLSPIFAKNILEILAKFQGKEENPWRDEEPGKILHEIRFGELSRGNKIPHSPYYGTADATLLWIMLLYDYIKWTNDIQTLEKLWKNALDCLMWMDTYPLYNGYVAYKTKSKNGLENQGWKDSFNSNIHSDGSLAEPPIALVEIQGYYYAAKVRLAELSGYIGENNLKNQLLQEAKIFKERFHKDFWMEDLQFYAMGLDKDGNQMKVISSNPGHCLETGIIDNYYAQIVAERLFKPDMFSGWGIRTLSSNTLLYNPISYHNGSIWPHDNSIIAYGLTKIGRMDLTLKIVNALFDAARLMTYKRLPELYCGFTRAYKRMDPPVSYPVACNPQAWAAASVFLLIQSMLNIIPDAQNSQLGIYNSIFPNWLDYLRIENIQIGNAIVDTEFRMTSRGLVINIPDKRGIVDIFIKK